jgi:hypothetical protein
MFGLSISKLLVLGLAIYGAWQLFKWIERRNIAKPPAPPEAPVAPPEEDKAVEMEQDPNTGVWRPKRD